MKRNLQWIADAAGGRITVGNEIDAANRAISEISIDSRRVSKGCLFIPVIGEKHDAHEFLPNAVKAGAGAVLFANEKRFEDETKHLCEEQGVIAIKVEDTTFALQALAKKYLEEISPVKIGVTGSVGKTSTKDMLVGICSKFVKTSGNAGNFNNHIGLPLTILSSPEDTEVLVLEMGMDKPGEIALLADIVNPDLAIITIVGESHLENLKTRENILKAKLEIAKNFSNKNFLIVNSDNDLLNADVVKSFSPHVENIVRVGKETSCDYVLSDICENGEKGIKFNVRDLNDSAEVVLPMLGRHNAMNASLAIAAACMTARLGGRDSEPFSGITLGSAAAALADAEITERRLTNIKLSRISIIDDSYNASPESMKSALSVLAELPAQRRVAILGDMYELGEESADMHEDVGMYAASKGINLIITVGELAEDIGCGAARYMAQSIFSSGTHSPNPGAASPLEALAALAGMRAAGENHDVESDNSAASDICSDNLLEVLHFSNKERLIENLGSIIREGDRILVKASNSLGLSDVVMRLREMD